VGIVSIADSIQEGGGDPADEWGSPRLSRCLPISAEYDFTVLLDGTQAFIGVMYFKTSMVIKMYENELNVNKSIYRHFSTMFPSKSHLKPSRLS